MPGCALLGEPAFCSARRLTDGRTDRGAAGAQRRNSCCAFAAWFYRHARRLAAAQPPHSCSCSPPRCCPGCPVSPPYPSGVVTAPRFAWQRPGPAELPADRRPDRQDRGLRALALQVQSKAGLGEQGGSARLGETGGAQGPAVRKRALLARPQAAQAPWHEQGFAPKKCLGWIFPLEAAEMAGLGLGGRRRAVGGGWGSARGSGRGDSGSRRRGKRQKAGVGSLEERHGGAGGCRGSRAGAEGLGVRLWGGTAGLGGCGEAGAALWPVPYA